MTHRAPPSKCSTIPSSAGLRCRSLSPILLALLLLLACLSLPARADESFQPGSLSLEEIIPGETLLFCEFSGINALLDDRQTLDLFQLWSEPEVQDFFAEAKATLPTMLKQAQGPDIPIKELWELLRGETALAINTRLTIFAQGGCPSTALGIDMGNKKEQFLGVMHQMFDMLAGMKGLERGRTEHRGFEIGYIGEPKKRLMICYTTIQNLFVATINRYFLEDIIACHLDRKPALAQNPVFQRCRSRVGGEAVRGLVYCNAAPVLGVLEPFCPYEVQEWSDMLGIDQVGALCLATANHDGRARDSLFIDCPGEKTGLLKALAPNPISQENLHRAPPDTLVFMDAVFDPELIAHEVDGFVKHALPEFYGMFRSGFAEFHHKTGFDLEKEIFAALGRELTLNITLPKTGGMVLIPDIIVSVAVENEERFKALQDKVLGMMSGWIKVDETTFNGHVMQYITVPKQGVPVTPTMTINDGRLLLTSTPLTMKKYLNWLKKGEPGLISTADFRKIMKGMPEEASLFSYIDLRRVTQMVYENGAVLLSMFLARDEVPFDAALLPMSESITKHMSNATSYMVMDENGILLSGECPLGIGAVLAAAASITDYLVEHDLLGGLIAQGMGGHPMTAHAVAEAPKPRKAAVDNDYDAASKMMGEERFVEAEAAFCAWIDTHGNDPAIYRAHANRGYCRLKLGQCEAAMIDYAIVAENDESRRSTALYNLACGASLLEDREKALHYLDKAIDSGFSNYKLFVSDTDLDNIKYDPQFKALMDKLRARMH